MVVLVSIIIVGGTSGVEVTVHGKDAGGSAVQEVHNFSTKAEMATFIQGLFQNPGFP